MNATRRFAAALLLFGLCTLPAARAQDVPGQVLDQGRLVTFEGDRPVATERFQYLQQGDSLLISAGTERRIMVGGKEQRYTKAMVLVTRADDFGLLNYTSNEHLGEHLVTRSILPGDTVLTCYHEKDGFGAADMIERPPGRVFAMDQGLFTLFDVIGRNLQHRMAGSRPVQIVVLEPAVHVVEAIATAAGPDTVTWGGKRVITERIALSDSTSAFTLWLSPEGHMLRLESADGRLVVMRDPPSLPPVTQRTRPRAKPRRAAK